MFMDSAINLTDRQKAMISQHQINQLIQEENADAINLLYWELPLKTQRLIDRLIAKYWRFN
jgi:hypothetical protein